MGAYLDTTAANPALKEMYLDQVVEQMVNEDNPFLAMVSKKTNAGGKYIPQPVIIGTSQGRSATFSNAQGNQSAAQLAEFNLVRKRDYSIATIDHELLLASATDVMSFLNDAKLLIDAAILAASNSAAGGLFRGGTGTRGQISTISSGVITLVNAVDVVQFELNQTLQANATDGGTPRAALGYVIAVDTSAGTVTVASTAQGGAAGTPTSWQANDYLLVQGDNNALPSGLQAWLPTSAPTSTDNFYGVNRSTLPTRLAGVRYSGTGQSNEEALIDGAMLLAREARKPADKLFCTFTSAGALEKALGSKVQYTDFKGPGNIMFSGFTIRGPRGMIDVVPDRNCTSAQGFLLRMDTWKLYSLNPVPHIFKYGSDTMEMLRVYNADAAELRCGMFYNLGCNAPGWNAVIALSA